jgi:hypothetical protein
MNTVNRSTGSSSQYHKNPVSGKFQCCVVIRICYRYPSVINLGKYPLTPWEWKKLKETQFWYITVVLKSFEIIKKAAFTTAVLSWNLPVYRHFRNAGTNGSLILISLPEMGTGNSLIMKNLKNLNWPPKLFWKVKVTTQHCQILLLVLVLVN